MAYTKSISTNSPDSHQTSPGYVLTFVRLENRDTVNYKLDSQTTRKPLVVVNDAVSINIQYSKSNPIPTLSCILKQGDLNYITAIAPGDYVLANMVNWEKDAMDIRKKAEDEKPINLINDGFKGLFKILDVNMALSVAPSGEKLYQVQVTARGFDEFNNILYFNPALPEALSGSNGYLGLNSFHNFAPLIKRKNKQGNVQEIIKEIINRTIGQGFDEFTKSGTKLNQIPAYQIPQAVGNLLGISNAQYVSNINKYYLGIWPEQAADFASFFSSTNSIKSTNTKTEVPMASPAPGTPGLSNDAENQAKSSSSEVSKTSFYQTGIALQGSRTFAFEDFQYVRAWSLLTDYSNSSLNESYTCFRISPDGRSVYPSVVVRQKPFNTPHFENFIDKNPPKPSGLIPHTPFLSLPAWKISPDLILNLNIGRSDAGRINFVIVSTKSQSIEPNFNEAAQIAMGNFVEDKRDIVRNGRKPYPVTCYFDSASAEIPAKSREWALLIADWLFNGHLKLNGSMQTLGIQEPICVGDNLEFDGVIYHIETINHNMSISPEGVKSFRTNLTLSMGIDKNSGKEIPVYGEMENQDSYYKRMEDAHKEKVLPGFSDTQDLPERSGGEEVYNSSNSSFTNPQKKEGNK